MGTRLLVGRRETERLDDAETELILGQAVGACCNYRPQNGPTEKTHEQKIVEVAGLKRRVLPIVREPKQFSLGLWNSARRLVHPLESTGHEKSRRGAPSFAREARQLAALAHPLVGLVLAAEAECKLSRDEPELSATSAMATVWLHQIGDGRALLAIGPQPLDAVALFEPALRVAVQVAIEGKIRIIVWSRAKISRHIIVVFGIQRRIVDIAGEKPDVAIILVLGDDVVFVSAVPAEARRVKPVTRSIGILELTLEQNGSRLGRK